VSKLVPFDLLVGWVLLVLPITFLSADFLRWCGRGADVQGVRVHVLAAHAAQKKNMCT
jgi:hypothetical protein